MKILNINNNKQSKIIEQSIKTLKLGGLIIFPTETTYGAGVDATNNQAIKKLLAYKSRREGKPLSIAVSDKKMASEYVDINNQAKKLIDQFLPGPITIICKTKKCNLANGVASEFNTLGIRIPDYELILNLTKKYKKPITATSANASGKKRPYTIDDILNNLSQKQLDLIDLIIDVGELPHNDPSTVIDTTLSTPVAIRKNSNTKKYLNLTKKITLTSRSENETKEIAGKLMLKNWNKVNQNGLVITLDGSLGTGKTVFAKGIAQFLNIDQVIKSPTYSYIEEYEYQRHKTSGKFYHLDMWKVEDKNLFNKLKINSLFKKNNIIVIEWFDQISNYISPLFKETDAMHINISQINNNRELEIFESK